MWRLPCLRRRILPVPVTLKRFATAFLVFAFPDALAMGGGNYLYLRKMQDDFNVFTEFSSDCHDIFYAFVGCNHYVYRFCGKF